MPLPDLIEIVPLKKPVQAEITVPGSKSITNRALALAALADGVTTLRGALWSEDTQVMVQGLQRLGFAVEVEADARRAASRTAGLGERVDVPFATIDPPGSRDLDQAMHIERSGEGHRVRYAIADVGAFVTPGAMLDGETHARGVTVYAPDRNTPLHPLVLSEGAASLDAQQIARAAGTISYNILCSISARVHRVYV